MHVVTEIDASGALLARNAYNTEFADLVAFFDVDDPQRTLTGDRSEFIGRNGSLRHPAAMGRVALSGRVGARHDPCGAIQLPIELADGEVQPYSRRRVHAGCRSEIAQLRRGQHRIEIGGRRAQRVVCVSSRRGLMLARRGMLVPERRKPRRQRSRS